MKARAYILYAQFRSPTANGTDGTVGQEVEMAAPIPVYAEVPADHTEVDKSKKKKKKKIEDENLNGTLDETKKVLIFVFLIY